MLNKSTKYNSLRDAIKGVAMVDAGKKINNTLSNKPYVPKDKYYPSISLSAEQAPFLTTHKVGDECVFVIKAKIVSHNKSDSHEGGSHDDYRLEIEKIGHEEHSK